MSKATVLVVEDDPNLLLDFQAVLELEGYHCLLTENGKVALDVLERLGNNIPNVIVAQFMMPVMTGLQLKQELQKHVQWKYIPFVFMSTRKIDNPIFTENKFNLVTPFGADDLIVAIENALGRQTP